MRRVSGVVEHAENHVDDVLVGERVVNVLALPAPSDEPLGSQHAQALRHRGELVVEGGGELGHAELTLQEQLEHAEPSRLACRTEQARGPLDGCVAEAR